MRLQETLQRFRHQFKAERRNQQPRKNHRRLQLELLESRVVPAVSLLNHFDSVWSGAAPPDTCGAAGPYSYIESGNYYAQIYNKSTNATIAGDDLGHFFHTVGGIPQPDAFGGLADATMCYDEIIGRFIVASLDLDRSVNPPIAPSQCDFAVSKTSNPTAMDTNNWTFSWFATSEGTAWSDYPGNIGYNHDALVFTWNMTSGHVLVDALKQSDLANSAAGASYTYFDYGGSNLRPVTMHDSVAGDPMWFVTEHGDGSTIDLKRFDNILGSTINDHTFHIGVNSYGGVNAPLNPDGTAITAKTNGGKIMKAAERYNDIVACQQVGVGSTENDARWYEFNVSDPNNPYLVQQGNVSAGNNTYIQMPGIDIDYNGNIGMSYIRSGTDSSTDYMSDWITGWRPGDSSGVMEGSVEIKAGDSNYGGGRQGDFSGINVDPSNGTFWVDNEYSGGGISHQEIANFAMNAQTFYLVGGQLQIFGDQLGANYNDTITIDVNGRGGVYATLNGEAASFDSGQVTSIYIDPRGGTNYVYIYNVPAGLSAVDVTGDGVNHVTIGNGANGVQGINSFIFVYNGYPTPSTTGWSTLTIDDTADTVGRNATMYDQAYGVGSYQTGFIVGLAPAQIQWFDNSAGTFTGGVESLTIDGGSGGNTFNLLEDGNLWSGTYLVGHASFFDDIVNIGNAGSAQGIAGYLSLSNPPGFNDIFIDDSADGTARTTTITSSSVSGLTPGFINYVSGDTNSLTIKTGNVLGNVINVLSTGTTTNLSGVDANTVNIGSNAPSLGGTLANIAGPLNVSNASIMTVDDSGDTTAQTATITNNSISGTWSPAAITYTSGGTLNIHPGSGGDTLNVQSTASGMTTNIIGTGNASGNTTVNVGNASSVQGILGTLNIENPPSYNTINVDDSADTTARTVTLSTLGTNGSDSQGNTDPWGQIIGLAPAHINYEYGDTTSLTIDGGSGGNTFNVLATGVFFGPGNQATTLDTGTGNDSVNVQATSGTLYINGVNGTDTVTIGSLAPSLGGTLANIAGAVNVSNSSGHTNMIVDDSADGTGRNATITSTLITGLSTGPIGYTGAASGGVSSLTVHGPSAGSVYNIESTAAGTTTTVDGGPGNDAFLISPTAKNFGNIAGPLTVNAGGGTDPLTINDQNDLAADTYTIAVGSVQRTGSAGLTYTGMQHVTVMGGSGGQTFNINSTSAATPLFIIAGAGNDTFNVAASSGSLDNIQGTVFLNGGAGTNAVNVDDQNKLLNQTYTITATAVSRAGFAGLTYFSIQDLFVNGGKGADTYNIQSNSAATTVNGGAASDTFNVGSGGVINAILGPLTVNGNGGTNILNVNDSGTASGSYTVSSTVLSRVAPSAVSITYGTIKTVNLNTGTAGGAMLTVLSPVPAVTINYNASGSNNTLVGANVSNTWDITATNKGTLGKVSFFDVQNLTGGSGNDDFKFVGAGASIAGNLNGGGGTDKLDYSGNGGGVVSVNLQTGQATSIGGTFSAIESLVGSSNTGNKLTGANTTNLWSITGPGAGKVNLFSFSAIQNLVAGNVNDTFKFASSAGKVSNITGGAPAQGDWLDYSAFTAATPVTVNLLAGTATNVSGSISGIENVIGGAGIDSLTGDNNGNILIEHGGAGTIHGGTGKSLLIGGSGAATVNGGSGSDILIGGKTSYDTTSTGHLNLMIILAEWQSADTYAVRTDEISDGIIPGHPGVKLFVGAGGTVTLSAAGTLNDGAVAGMDWYFASATEAHETLEAGEILNNAS